MAISKPLVSIQIPCYNQEEVISKAIKSALAQTYENLEVVVCDDCSPDNTYHIAKQIIHPKLKVFQNSKNIGRVANYRHLLYDLVTGDWVINLDGDDWLTDPNYIQRAISVLEQFPGVVLYHANQRNLNKITKLIPTEKLDDYTLKMNGLDYIQIHAKVKYFYHIGSLYKRSIALEAGFYTEPSLNSDFVSIMKLCKYGDIIQSSLQVAVWDLNENSASLSALKMGVHQDNLRAIDHLILFYAEIFSPYQLIQLKKSLYNLMNYFYQMSDVMYSSHSVAIKKLIEYVNFSRDYVTILGMYVIRRVFHIRAR